MFKTFGVLALVLAGAMFLRPVCAVAADWHNGGGPYRYEHREGFRPEGRYHEYHEYREPRYEVRHGYYAARTPFYYGGARYGYGYGYGYAPRCR